MLLSYAPQILLSLFAVSAAVAASILYIRRKKLNDFGINADMDEIDKMNGHDFEEFCARLLRQNGIRIIELTKKSGDFGADIIIMFRGELCAVQCKRQEANVGVKAVQEAKTAESHYGAQKSVVLTNSYFTKQAVSLADENNVILWDRESLTGFISAANSRNAVSNIDACTIQVHVMPVIEPGFPEEGIEIVVNPKEEREIFLLTEKKQVILSLSKNMNAFIFRAGRRQKRITFRAEADDKIGFAVGFDGRKLLVFKIRR